MEDRRGRDCNRGEFTITSDAYVGTESYGFEITRAVIIVAAKNKSIYVGDTVPDLTNPTVGTDYTVTGLCGTGDKPENSDNTTTITNKDGSATTTKTDADGNVTSANASVTKTSDSSKVSKAGTVTVNMTKKATYELVTAKESKAITKEILATVKAVVILKNGTKKTVKMTIKVK
ncbi:MAG: hypothetical protein MR945_11255 [Agathobacter sp.]|nr:hypothetical protein [Agathobacter sp.]